MFPTPPPIQTVLQYDHPARNTLERNRMQAWRFLMPNALGFTLKNLAHAGIDKLSGAPKRTVQAAAYVAQNARQGDPKDVLRTLDEFAAKRRWLMSVGPEKGPLMAELAGRLPQGPRVLELGAYCGYSSILLAQSLGEKATIVPIEIDSDSVSSARANVEHAGLSEQISFILGPSSEMIAKLEGEFDLVFLDHWKDLYTEDLQRIEKHGLLRPGSVVIADNVGPFFGAEKYLTYVRGCNRYDNRNVAAHIEYQSVEDAVEISVWKGESVAD